MLEMGDGYAELYFSNPNGLLYKSLLTKLKGLRGGKRMRPQEINLITRGEYGLELTRMDVKRTKLDIDLFYEDNFKEVHQTILRRLNKKDDKGIVLLHGIPGTGKTTYLRYLVGKIKKRVLFVPPDMASQIVNPDLVRLLVDNPNCVLIIEDAENIIMQRQPGSDSAVSNLLNISDGLLSDFLNVQIICTFNSSLNIVDNALLRKGRLIAKYEFGKLSVPKAQRLSEHAGSPMRVITPMSVAEIMNQAERSYEQERPRIGFRVGAMNIQ
jgi:SpoVK/Ycf46/Vps4 family AAA+-type ATPase